MWLSEAKTIFKKLKFTEGKLLFNLLILGFLLNLTKIMLYSKLYTVTLKRRYIFGPSYLLMKSKLGESKGG